MEASLERGDCPTCRQQRVLGRLLDVGAFRCCACIDEYGEGHLHHDQERRQLQLLKRCKAHPRDQAPGPTNWWASEDPPEHVTDVPYGHLGKEQITLRTGCAEQTVHVVIDPDHNYFSGHGAERVWPASIALGRWFLDRYGHSNAAGLRVIELGAGSGLPSMILARLGARAILTDVPWVLQMMKYNIEANFSAADPSKPLAAPLRWGNAADARAALALCGGTADLVIAADVIYREEDAEVLLSTLEMLGNCEAIFAAVERDSVVQSFLSRLAHIGWNVELLMVESQLLIFRIPPRSQQACRNARYKVATASSFPADGNRILMNCGPAASFVQRARPGSTHVNWTS